MKTKEGGVMDIQKEREAFEKQGNIRIFVKQCLFDEQLNEYSSKSLHDYTLGFINGAWWAWQAKAQAVPEGFVLINASDRNQEMLELIDQRDYMESQAEELKDKLQTLYGVDFGEHSSCNFPFQNAIDYDDSDLVLVPKEPTYEMLEAGSEARSRTEGHVASIWGAMIEAQEPAND